MNNKTVYALLTKKCNLSCNYCDVRINNDFFNRELFINILDKFSFVEVPSEYVEDVLQGMKGKQIKGRNCNVEIAGK